MEAYLCRSGRAADRQSEAPPDESSVWPGPRNGYPRSFPGSGWRSQQRFWLRSRAGGRTGRRAQCARSSGDELLGPRGKFCQPPGYHGKSRFRRSGDGYHGRRRCCNSERRYSNDHGWKRHRGREQGQQEIRDGLRSRKELPPLRVYLGPIKGYIWHRPTRHADRNRSGSAHWPACWTATRTASADSAESAATTETAAVVTGIRNPAMTPGLAGSARNGSAALASFAELP